MVLLAGGLHGGNFKQLGADPSDIGLRQGNTTKLGVGGTVVVFPVFGTTRVNEGLYARAVHGIEEFRA